MTEQNEPGRDAAPEAAEQQDRSKETEALGDIEELETQFEEFAEKLWYQGLIYKTYTGAVDLARKEGYEVKTMPLYRYEVHEDAANDDYRIELYGPNYDAKHLMTLIFRQARSVKSKIPFRLKDFHLYKI